MPAENTRTRQSSESLVAFIASGTSRSRNRMAVARTRGTTVPNPASTRLSARNCSTSRPRPAPSALRNATSRVARLFTGQQQVRRRSATNQQQDDGRGEQDSAVCVRPRSLLGDDDHQVRPAKSFAVTQAQRRHGLPDVIQRHAGLDPRDDVRVVPGEVGA